jgi:hypothetical protein
MAFTALIPKMTSDTAPSGTVSSSGSFSDSYKPYYAFAQEYGQWLLGTPSYPVYIQYQSGTGLAATHYMLGNNSNSAWNSGSITLKGSNNGTDFTDLDTRASVSSSQNTIYSIASGSCGTYTHHRLQINAGGAELLSIITLQLYNASAASDPDTVVSTAGGNWKVGGLSGTSVKSGVTFGLSGTGSLLAEQHTDNEVLKSASVPGNYNDANLTGTNVRNGVTFGLSGTGSYLADVLTAEQSQKLDELWRFKGCSAALPLTASGDGVTTKVLTSGTVSLTITTDGVTRS